MRHGSLFSGIGGFDLAAEWMGWENVFHCEWNPFGQRVLHHYWPNAETFTDITKTDFTKYANTVDIITGGFPCQPYSSAGKRLGKEDERHLWPEMLRAIREISPRFVVGENVRGLTNWNGGLVFDEVCTELESYGYSVAPVIIPACGLNAPHKRERIWFVAHSNDTRTYDNNRVDTKWQEKNQRRERELQFECGQNGYNGVTTDANSERHRGGNNQPNANKPKERAMGKHKKGDGDRIWGKIEGCGEFTTRPRNWDQFPTQSPICGGNDGISTALDGVAFSKWRAESVKAYGNAIVPQVAYEIFKAITKTT